jgi:RNA polymerase sigma-70 factor (ECF subfamily)
LAKHNGSGDWENLFSQYREMVFKTAYLMLDDAQRAEDVLQEVFIKVHRSWHSYDSRKGSLATWLHRITVNQCLSERRNSRPPSVSLETLQEQGLDPPDAHSKPPDEVAAGNEQSERIRQAMNILDGKHRAVIVLRYFHDLSYEEIARTLNIPQGTVKSRLNTGLRMLRAELAEGREVP